MSRFVMFAVLTLIVSTANALSARSYIVLDEHQTVLLEQNADQHHSIASITKLFTARTALKSDPDELIEIVPSDRQLGRSRSTPLKVGHQYKRSQLIELALISSDNVAASALARIDPIVSPLPPETTIVEGTGLDSGNISTARSLGLFAQTVLESQLARTSVLPMTVIDHQARSSTNPLIGKFGWIFHLSKTGFTNAAGGCLVVVFESGQRLLTVVVLGSRDVPGRWRDLYEIRRLVDSSEFSAPFVTRRRR